MIIDHSFRFPFSDDLIAEFTVSETYQEKHKNKDMNVQKQSQ